MLIYTMSNYRWIAVPKIKERRISHKDEALLDAIGNLSLMTSCPIVVIAHLVQELEGPSTELTRLITSFEKFYDASIQE